jgi:uroporphyrinogen-III decarboxylase
MRTIGHAETLELMLLEPEFIEDVIATHTDFTIAMLEIGMREGYQFDAIWFFSDLCYKNDVRKLKKEYGKDIAFFGNINMDILARGITREIEEEVVSKIMAAKEEGGYIFHSDHSVPPTVSFDTYRMVVDLARTHGNY